MSIYDGPYFSINKILCTCVGLWPFKKSRNIVRFSLGAFLIASCISFVKNITAIVVHSDDIDRVMLCSDAILIMMAEFLKLVGLSLSEKNMKELFENLERNWKIIDDPEEKQILVNYAKTGRILTLLYTVCMTFSAIAISLSPLMTKVLDLISPLENPRPPIYLLEGEYKLDRNVYFWPLFFCDAAITSAVALITMAADSTYFVVAQQSCALYAIVIHRLRQLRPKGSDISYSTEESDSYTWVVEAVQLHRAAINFTNIISDGYSAAFFFIFVGNIVAIPLTVCAMFAGAGGVLFLTFGALLICLMIHLFIIFYVGQNIINHGEDLYDNVCNNEWYLTPQRTKKLLTIFMLRCSQPPSLTAGGILTIDFVTYSTILRSSASYITVLLSFR